MRIVGIALLTAALVAAVLILIAYERDIGAARARLATGSQIAQTPCGPIEYASLGSGPALLIVHGAGGGFDQAIGMAAPPPSGRPRGGVLFRGGGPPSPPPAGRPPAAPAAAPAGPPASRPRRRRARPW